MEAGLPLPRSIGSIWPTVGRIDSRPTMCHARLFLNGLPAMRGTRASGLVRLVQKMARSARLPAADAFLMNSTYFDTSARAALYTADARQAVADSDPWDQHRAHLRNVEHADFLNQMLYLDTKTFMVSLNLTYNDKMSMASSVEVRVPFSTASWPSGWRGRCRRV